MTQKLGFNEGDLQTDTAGSAVVLHLPNRINTYVIIDVRLI